MIEEISVNELPENAFQQSYRHVIGQALSQRPRPKTRFFKGPNNSFAVDDADMGFNLALTQAQDLPTWSLWAANNQIPLVAGEENLHYGLLTSMGDQLPIDHPIQVLCRYETQDYCIHETEMPPLFETSLRLRRAEAKDIDRLFHFYSKSETMQARSRESLLYTIEHNRLFYLQKVGKIISAAMTHCESDKAGLIGGVYTPKAHRGKGYAYLCMHVLMESLKQDNKAPCLFYEKNNTSAKRLYQKLGFKVIESWILIELNYHQAGAAT